MRGGVLCPAISRSPGEFSCLLEQAVLILGYIDIIGELCRELWNKKPLSPFKVLLPAAIRSLACIS